MAAQDYRPFGRTGMKVSPLGLGCMMFGGRTDQTDTNRIIDRAMDAGINFLDTANVYGLGNSEEATGVALARDGKREKVILATKVSHAMNNDDPNAQGNSRRHIIAQCEASLRRLNTDYIDLYQIHRPQSDIPIDETLRALDDLVRSGKVRYIGCSNFSGWRIIESLWVSRELGLNRFVSEQSPYNLLDRRIERELLPATQSYDVAVIVWGPIASGMLTGKYRKDTPMPSDSRYATKIPVATLDNAPPAAPSAQNVHAIYASRLTDNAYAAVTAYEQLARAKGLAMADMAMAWVLQQPGITTALTGPRTMEQLEGALRARDVQLDAATSAAIDAIVPPGTHASPFMFGDMGPNRHAW